MFAIHKKANVLSGKIIVYLCSFVLAIEEATVSMAMKNPPHPGGTVRVFCIEETGLTVTAAAEKLGVTRQALNNLVNEKSGISPEMAVRLAKVFGSTPEHWLRMQAAYDLAQVQQDKIDLKRYEPT